MIDDMQGLFARTSEACAAGRREGRAEALRVAVTRISQIGSAYETAGEVEAFHAVEECAAALVEVRKIFEVEDAQRQVGGVQ